MSTILDLLVDAICVVDADGKFVYVSAACESIFGYTADEMIGRPMIELVHPEDRALTLGAVGEIVAGVQKPNFENRYVRKDGQTVHIMWTARWSPTWQMRVAVARDVSARKHAETRQAALYAISEAAFAAEDLNTLFARIHEIVNGLLPASGFLVAHYNAAQDELSFPYHVDEFESAPASGPLDSGSLSAQVIRSGETLLLSREPKGAALHRGKADVGGRTTDWLGVPLITNEGITGALVVKSHSDEKLYTAADTDLLKFVSTQIAAAIERQQAETLLRHVAKHDSLTELPNRSLLFDRITTALARARRERRRLSLLYLDLDMFKQVNDSFGHVVGDQLLQQVATRLKQCVRESDTVGRMAGDEFIVLLGRIQNLEDASQVAEKIRHSLCKPFRVDGHVLSISPSIGISHYPEHGETGELLIDHADHAMYKAKQDGGNRFTVGIGPDGKAIDPA